MAEFTATQGRYLAFIHAYSTLHGFPPAEANIAQAMCVSAPSVNLMVKMLEKKGLILRHPGQARSLQILVPDDEIPLWNNRERSHGPDRSAKPPRVVWAPPASLYVVSAFLLGGPVTKEFANKQISRVIEIRGDQTLEQLHQAIFTAYDRRKQHLYQFQFGKRPFDRKGRPYGIPDPHHKQGGEGDPRTTKLDDLKLQLHRPFGYWFDFGEDWFHQLEVERIERAIPTVTYPRMIKRVGKSPPQR